jgi:hypothetical protein
MEAKEYRANKTNFICSPGEIIIIRTLKSFTMQQNGTVHASMDTKEN